MPGWHFRPVRALAIARCLALACVAAAGCDREVAGGALDGPAVFRAVCSTCHGERGQPSAAMVAKLGVKDLTARELRAKVTPAFVAAQVRRGSENKLMPSFVGALNDAQIDAVAAYVASPAFVK
jgi:mono/diheme cytochrome c family protein